MSRPASPLADRLRLAASIGLYTLTAYGLDGATAVLLDMPTDCPGLAAAGGGAMRQWMTWTFVAHLMLGFVSRHLLLLRFAPAHAIFARHTWLSLFAKLDGVLVLALIGLTALVPNAMIYFSAAPLLPLFCAFGLTWMVRRGIGRQFEWQHLALGFEIAVVMWIGAIHAGSIALRCASG